MKKFFIGLLTFILVVFNTGINTIYAEEEITGELTESLIDESKYPIKSPYTMEPEGIAVHNTYNKASARDEISYMKNNPYKISYHIAVDDKEAILAIPLDRNAWHAGESYGNRHYIGLEICYSTDYSDDGKFEKAEERAVKVVAQICYEKGWTINNVKFHHDFSGKDCPHRTNRAEFKKRVEVELERLNSNKRSSSVLIEKSNTKVVDSKNYNGWRYEENQYYYYEDGKLIRNTLKIIDGEIYSFNNKGICTNRDPERTTPGSTSGRDKINEILNR